MAANTRHQMHVVLSDQHIPYQDKVIEDLSIAFIKEHQPHTVHLLGDVVDLHPGLAGVQVNCSLGIGRHRPVHFSGQISLPSW